MHSLSGIRTSDPSNQAAADLHLRPRGHRDRLSRSHLWKFYICSCIMNRVWDFGNLWLHKGKICDLEVSCNCPLRPSYFTFWALVICFLLVLREYHLVCECAFFRALFMCPYHWHIHSSTQSLTPSFNHPSPIIIPSSTTERHGRVVNSPASYLGGPRFKFRPGDRLSWLRFSWFSSVPPGKCRDSTLKLGHDRFLPHPFQCFIHLSSFHSTLIVLVAEKASLNKL
jgi:hypothetical protein